jgi:hypothetical protein
MSYDKCQICGPSRERTWSEAEGATPLKDFIKWLLREINADYHTYAFSHYGGRYDMVLCLGEL